MRGRLAMAVCVCFGCGHSASVTPQAAQPVKPVPTDKVTALYRNMRTANNDIDVSQQDLEDGMTRSKALAAVAGGDAARGLANVGALLNTAGEALSDYDDVPATLEEYKGDFSANDEKRLKSIDAAISALQAVDSSSDILDDLSSNAPADKRADLKTVTDDTDEADGDLRAAIKLMGGKIPAGDEDEGDAE